MADVIIIKHKFTANTVTTSVKMPGRPPISKQWRRAKNGFVGKFTKDWDEEGLPPEVVRAADNHNHMVCDEMKS